MSSRGGVAGGSSPGGAARPPACIRPPRRGPGSARERVGAAAPDGPGAPAVAGRQQRRRPRPQPARPAPAPPRRPARARRADRQPRRGLGAPSRRRPSRPAARRGGAGRRPPRAAGSRAAAPRSAPRRGRRGSACPRTACAAPLRQPLRRLAAAEPYIATRTRPGRTAPAPPACRRAFSGLGQRDVVDHAVADRGVAARARRSASRRTSVWPPAASATGTRGLRTSAAGAIDRRHEQDRRRRQHPLGRGPTSRSAAAPRSPRRPPARPGPARRPGWPARAGRRRRRTAATRRARARRPAAAPTACRSSPAAARVPRTATQRADRPRPRLAIACHVPSSALVVDHDDLQVGPSRRARSERTAAPTPRLLVARGRPRPTPTARGRPRRRVERTGVAARVEGRQQDDGPTPRPWPGTSAVPKYPGRWADATVRSWAHRRPPRRPGRAPTRLADRVREALAGCRSTSELYDAFVAALARAARPAGADRALRRRRRPRLARGAARLRGRRALAGARARHLRPRAARSAQTQVAADPGADPDYVAVADGVTALVAVPFRLPAGPGLLGVELVGTPLPESLPGELEACRRRSWSRASASSRRAAARRAP